MQHYFIMVIIENNEILEPKKCSSKLSSGIKAGEHIQKDIADLTLETPCSMLLQNICHPQNEDETYLAYRMKLLWSSRIKIIFLELLCLHNVFLTMILKCIDRYSFIQLEIVKKSKIIGLQLQSSRNIRNKSICTFINIIRK